MAFVTTVTNGHLIADVGAKRSIHGRKRDENYCVRRKTQSLHTMITRPDAVYAKDSRLRITENCFAC